MHHGQIERPEAPPGHHLDQTAFAQQLRLHLVTQIEAGTLHVQIGRTFTLDEIVEAHRCMEENRPGVKIVVLTWSRSYVRQGISPLPTFEVMLDRMLTPAGHEDLEVLFTRDQIQQRVAEMGEEIAHDYADQKIIMIGVLKGAAIFLADLARAVPVDCTFDFVAVSSYGKGSTTSGAARLIKDLDLPIEGKHVIVVEDILDTGVTLGYLTRMFERHHPASLKIAAFLDKPARRIHPIQADYVGFTIPNHFVVGYGLDYAERYRNLPDICVLPPENLE